MRQNQEAEQMEISIGNLVERLQKLSSSVISDVLDVSGYTDQSLSGTIRPLRGARDVFFRRHRNAGR
jgi:hypothetical protein